MPTYPIITSTPNLAGLRALDTALFSTSDVVEVLGYFTANDGGGGAFYFDSSTSSGENGGTIIQPTTGSGRWLRHGVDTTISVRWFGAKGDGSTDDTTEVQAALDQIGQASEIVFSPGTYLVGKISLPSNVCLRGDAATLKLKGAANSELISIVNKSNVRIENLKLEGNSTGQTGYGSLSFNTYGLVLIRASIGIRISGCSIADSYGAAIDALVISNSTIEKNNITGGYMDYGVIDASEGVFPVHQVHIGGLSHENKVIDNYLGDSDQGGIGWASSSPDPSYGPSSPGADYVSNGNVIQNNVIDRSQNHSFEAGLYLSAGAPWLLVSLRPLEVAGQRGMLIAGNIVRPPTGAFVDGFDHVDNKILLSVNRVFRNGQKVRFLKLSSDPSVIPAELQSGYFYVVAAGGTSFQVSSSPGGAAVNFTAPSSTQVLAYCGEPAIDPGFISLGAQCIDVTVLGNKCEGGIVSNPLESNGGAINCLFTGNTVELLTGGACGGGPDGASFDVQYLNNIFGSMYGPIYIAGGNTIFRGNTVRAGRVGTSLSGSMVASVVVQAENTFIEDNRFLIDHEKMASALITYPIAINGANGCVIKGNVFSIVPDATGGSYNRQIKAIFIDNSSKIFIVDNLFDSRRADNAVQQSSFVLFGSSENSSVFLHGNSVRNGGGSWVENASGVSDLVITDVRSTAGTTDNYTYYSGTGGKTANFGLGLGGDLAVVQSANADIGLVAQNVLGIRIDGSLGSDQLTVSVNHSSTMKRILLGAADSGGTGYRALRIAN